MKNLLVIILCSLQAYNVHSVYVIDYNYWTDAIQLPFPIKVTISEIPYNQFDIKDNIFFHNQFRQNLNISYPSSNDYPKINFSEPVLQKFIDFNDKSKPEREAANSQLLNDIRNGTNNMNIVLNYGIFFRHYSRLGQENKFQYFIAWNTNETFLMVIVNNYLTNLEGYYIKLGRGREKIVLDKFIARPGVYFFSISSPYVKILNCNNITESRGITFNAISLSPNNLSNMGGERIDVMGPCPTNEPLPSINIYSKNGIRKPPLSASLYLNIDKTGFYFITPLFWYPEMMVFNFTYGNVVFQTDAQVYLTTNYSLLWVTSGEMNNVTFDKKEIRILTKEYSKEIIFVVMNIDFPNSERPTPKFFKNFCVNDVGQFCALSIDNLKSVNIDVTKQIGYFYIKTMLSEIRWSPPFSLVWLRSDKTQQNKDLETSVCRQFLTENKKQTQMECPAHSSKMKFYQSKFRKENFVNTLTPELKDCYVQMASNDYQSRTSYSGVTCCYNEYGYLIYGQDYYLHKSAIVASYGWTHCPIMDPYNHYIVDRLPMIRCCSTNEINNLCSQYWELHNNIKSIDHIADYSGDVFGDPHFIPFHSHFNYSFLSRGEYWLVKGVPNNFGLQGRFYSFLESQSLLKAIAFGNSSHYIMISTKRYVESMFDWSILVNNQPTLLPVSLPGLKIFQSNDTKKLNIYISILGKYFGYIELSRLYIEPQFDEYLNLKIFLSKNFVGKLEGGLLGKIDPNSTAPSLWPRYPPEKADSTDERYFKFAKTWQIINSSESLFSYLPNTDEQKLLNSDTSIQNLTFSKDSLCGDNKFCNIDKFQYSSGTVAQETLLAYQSRQEYNEDVINSLKQQYRDCGRPMWPFIRLSSDNFNGGAVINVTGCIDPKMNISSPVQTIICRNSSLTWDAIPEMKLDICNAGTPLPVGPKTNDNMFVYIFVPIAAIIFVAIMVGIAIFIKRRRNCEPTTIRSEFSTTSQEPLAIATSIPLDEVYDTWNNIQKESADDYGVYSQIKKTNVDGNKK